MLSLLTCMLAAIAPAGAQAPPDALEVTPSGHRTSYDVTLHVRRDGQLYLGDALVLDAEVAEEIRRLHARDDALRVVVTADPDAPYDRVVEALELAHRAGAGRVALEVGESAERAADPLFPGASGAEVVSLDEEGLSDDQREELAPRRWRFPQDPYAHTDFTAYTLPQGEVKLGAAWIQVGALPRVQVSTAPMADLLGIYNAQVKANVARVGRFDLSVTGSGMVVPISQLLQRLDLDGSLSISGQRVKGEDLFVRSLSFVGLGLQSSMRITEGWTVHAGGGWTRVTGRGAFDFQNLPVVVVPGLDPVGGDLTVVSRVVGELFEARLATDVRFNRRDSLIVQAAAPLYGSARGAVSGELDGIPPEIANLDFIVSYGQPLPPLAGYRASIAWQFSWPRVDLRFGIGSAAIDGTWWLQAFDLAYRFGGRARAEEARIREGYRTAPSEGSP